MLKVKVFESRTNAEGKVEDRINAWLAENQNIEVVTVSQSAVANSQYYSYTTVILWYKELAS